MKVVVEPKKKVDRRGDNLRGKPKIGGRRKGVPNKRTVEAAERAARDVADAKAAGRKLGKDVLEDFMHLFAGIAASCQPLPAGVEPRPGHVPDEPRFLIYAKLAVDTAKNLADFQSPKFKAIAVVAGPNPNPAESSDAKTIEGKVVQLHDAAGLSRTYQRMLKKVK